jgi:hypothetical protein
MLLRTSLLHRQLRHPCEWTDHLRMHKRVFYCLELVTSVFKQELYGGREDGEC